MSAAKKGTGDGKAAAEKSKFAQTCNRLSLFLKEKGNISFEINAKFAAAAAADPPPKAVDTTGVSVSEELYPAKATSTVDLLSNMNVCGQQPQPQPQPKESENIILPEYVILDSSSELEDSSTHISGSSSSSKAVKTGQMSIFYQGKVMVVDDVPEDRFRYVMLVAKNGVVPADGNKLELLAAASTTPSSSSQQQQIINGENKDSDLPIARRASLNKFLAKRKDRATVRAAPYPPADAAAAGASSSGNKHTFDLNM